MEDCHVQPASSSTEAGIVTVMSSSGTDDGKAEDEADPLTQMLPECFVSVKLEHSEETENSMASAGPEAVPRDPDTSGALSLSTVTMQNEQKVQSTTINSVSHSSAVVTTSAALNSSSPCLHRGGSASFTAATMQELPSWLSHCYATGQISDASVHQSNQLFHQTPAYLTHDGNIAQTDRSSKMGTTSNGTSVTPSIGGLANGDICDSNTFLNYVLNQQRSNGIFLFDPTRSLPSGAEANDSQLSYMQQQKQLGNSVTRDTKHSIAPSVIPPVEGNPPRRDAATNTMPHYVPFHHDSKVAIDTCSSESLTICRGTNQCARCAALKMPHTCQMDGVSNSQGSPVLNFSVGVNERGTEVMNTSNAVAGNNKVYGNSIVLNNQAHFQECNSCSCNCAGQSCVDLSTSSFSGGKLGADTLPSGGHKAPTSGSKCNSTECKVKDPGIHYVEVNRSFSCDVCFKAYPTSTALMNHMRYHRGQRPYQCEICNKAFATNSHLVTHRRVHTGERPFQCRLCRRSFADRSAHVKHERTHGPNGTIIRRYKCDECGNSFVDSCGLKKHLRIHTGERPYCCSVCQKTFSTSSTFVAHKRIHSGERPYKCESCDKMFITKSHLLTHRRTHTGEKPFSCPVCSRAFADGSSFRRHERLHTGENRHTCDICGKGFPFDSSLAKHKQSHIPGTPTFVCMM